MSTRIVDWQLAQRIAVAISGEGPSWDGPGADELAVECDRAVQMVRRYTGLRPKRGLPSAELIGRDEWARTNLDSLRLMSEEVEATLAERVQVSGDSGGITSALAGAAAGVEVGLATGYLSQRVVGQYDIALVGPAREPRLLFVAPNLSAARERLDVDHELFLRWIAMHEATHAVQFSAVPWVREHIGSLASGLLTSAAIEVKPGELLGKLARLNPKELVRTVTSGQLVSLLWTEDQRRLVDELTATMTIIEGYAEHVMDAVGEELDPAYVKLRRRLDRDRERRGLLDQVVSRLLGLEMKLAQYRRGKAFADEVVRRAGIRALNGVWRGPEAVPTAEELDSPEEWLSRVSPRRRPFALFR